MTSISDVEQAEHKLLEVSQAKQSWSPKELRRAARTGNGFPREVISLAFWRLLSRGVLVLDEDRQVHLAGR